MLSDNVLQFSYTSNMSENNSNIKIRNNPFDHDTKELSDVSAGSSVSQMNNENDIFVFDHFDQHLDYCSKRSSIDDLTLAVKECKLKILKEIGNEDTKDKLIERLIELNEALHTAKETKKELIQPELLSISSFEFNTNVNTTGHKFNKYRHGFSSIYYCEVCLGVIKTGRSYFRCNECEICLHTSSTCIQGLQRACPASDFGHPSMFPSQIMSRRRFSSADGNLCINIDTYPITGNLSLQHFLCAECNYPLKAASYTDPVSTNRSQARFCHYYHKFYCCSCHWNNKHIIPSIYFMLNKWKEMSVCRSAFIKLKYLWNRALFRMPIFWQRNNTCASSILVIRRKLFYMRMFIEKCSILKKISESSPQWAIEQPYLVTMQFVGGICDGTMLETMQALYSTIVSHIAQCQTCQLMCSPCHMCNDPQRLTVMSGSVWLCSLCNVTCIHENCALKLYVEKSAYVCPNCSKD